MFTFESLCHITSSKIPTVAFWGEDNSIFPALFILNSKLLLFLLGG